MSIFSRLFNKNAESDGKEPADDDAASSAAEIKEGKRVSAPSPSKQSHSPAEAKGGTMRPVAPSLQINPPSAERSSASSAKVSVSTGADPKAKAATAASAASGGTSARVQPSSSQATDARAPQTAEAAPPNARGRAVSRATARLGSNATAPAYAPPPPPGPRRPSSRPPRGERAHASQGGAPVQPSSGVSQGRTTGGKASAEPAVGSPRPPDPPRNAPASPLGSDALGGPLTLEFGSSLNDSGPRVPVAAKLQAPPVQAPAPEPGKQRSSFATSEIDNVKLLNDLDEAFGAIVESANGTVKRLRPSEQPPPSHSITELKDLFSALAANHMQQVRDFMIGVRWGEAPRDWIPICEPAIASLVRAAKEMDLQDLLLALENYRDALRHSADATGTTIAGSTREALIAAYAKLTDLMPEAFGLDGERGRREAIIVHALLQQVPEVRKVTIDKIYAAGLSNLDNLLLAKADDIAATTGMSESLASRIVEKMQNYRKQIASLADATRSAERQVLGQLVADLRQLHQQFEAVASAWSEDAHTRKKDLRQTRAAALLQVKVMLARLGEVDRLNQLERLPFERKIEELERYLREASAHKAPAP